MDKQDLRELLRKEYENGAGITELCRKYNQSINTVKSWKKRDGWKKKQINAPLTNAPPKKKSAPKMKKGAIEKEIKIQQDILNGKSKQEIMSEYGISERTYYRKSKNARQLRLERTEKYLDKIVEEVYPDLETLLKNIEISKRNIIINVLKEVKGTNDIKKINDIKKAYDNLKAMGNDLIRTGKLLTSFELLEIDSQLTSEELQQLKLDIEANKNQVIKEKEQVVIIDDTDKN
jgi:putative pbsx phage terminase small subunit